MIRLTSTVLTLSIAIAAPVVAQPRPAPPGVPAPVVTPEPPSPPRQAAEPESRQALQGQPVNIRFDFAIIDEGGPQPSRKVVSMMVADRQSGLVRSFVLIPGFGDVPISVDALPTIERDGRIRARVTLEYRANPAPAETEKPGPPPTASMRLSFGILLESGRKVVAAQAADPVTDRRVTVEVTATVLK